MATSKPVKKGDLLWSSYGKESFILVLFCFVENVLDKMEKLNNWELLVRYGFAIDDVPQIFKIEIQLDMIKRSCSGKLKYEAYDIQHMTK